MERLTPTGSVSPNNLTNEKLVPYKAAATIRSERAFHTSPATPPTDVDGSIIALLSSASLVMSSDDGNGCRKLLLLLRVDSSPTEASPLLPSSLIPPVLCGSMIEHTDVIGWNEDSFDATVVCFLTNSFVDRRGTLDGAVVVIKACTAL